MPNPGKVVYINYLWDCNLCFDHPYTGWFSLSFINAALRHAVEPPFLEAEQVYAHASYARGPNLVAN